MHTVHEIQGKLEHTQSMRYKSAVSSFQGFIGNAEVDAHYIGV